jgi:hypothetical protein
MKLESSKMLTTRYPREFFSTFKPNAEVTEAEMDHLEKVLMASHDLRTEKLPGLTIKLVQNKEKPYTMDHVAWAKDITETQVREDLASGKLSKVQLKIMKEPEGIVNLNMANFEDKFRAEKQRLKMGKKPDVIESDDDCLEGTTEQYKMLAEHAALADNQLELSTQIKNGMLTHGQIKEILGSYNDSDYVLPPNDVFSDDASDWDDLSRLQNRVQKEFEIMPPREESMFDIPQVDKRPFA